MAAAASLAGGLAAPVQAAATAPAAARPAAPQPVSSVQSDQGGVHLTVLTYAAGVTPSAVSPSSVNPVGCSINGTIALGVESGGNYTVYCFSGHGTRQVNLFDVENFSAYGGMAGEYDHGTNNSAPCDRVQDFVQWDSFSYSPLAHVCWVEM